MDVQELKVILSLTDKSGSLPVLRSLPPLQPCTPLEYDELPDDALEIYAVGNHEGGPLLCLQHPEEAVYLQPLSPASLYALLSPFPLAGRVYLLRPLALTPCEPARWTTLVGDEARPATRCALVLPHTTADLHP